MGAGIQGLIQYAVDVEPDSELYSALLGILSLSVSWLEWL